MQRTAAHEAERTRRPTQLAIAARGRGLLAAAPEQGHAAFEEALRWHATAHQPFEQARTQLCHGEFLRRHQRRGEARAQLGAALATSKRLGAPPWALRTEAVLDATSGPSSPPRRAASPTDRLTPQELQVAMIVADGATNAEAAARLFLSAKTIEFHLSNAYRKLGIRSRAALVRKVFDGLPDISADVSLDLPTPRDRSASSPGPARPTPRRVALLVPSTDRRQVAPPVEIALLDGLAAELAPPAGPDRIAVDFDDHDRLDLRRAVGVPGMTDPVEESVDSGHPLDDVTFAIGLYDLSGRELAVVAVRVPADDLDVVDGDGRDATSEDGAGVGQVPPSRGPVAGWPPPGRPASAAG